MFFCIFIILTIFPNVTIDTIVITIKFNCVTKCITKDLVRKILKIKRGKKKR